MIQPGWLCDFLLTALVIQQRSFLTFHCFSSWLLRENHGCVELQSFEGTMEQSSLFFMRFGESWWFETDSVDCGIGCWFPVGLCVQGRQNHFVVIVQSPCLTLCNTMGCSMQASLSLTPRVCPSSCPSHQWCHPTISSSVALFSFCPKSFPSSGSFPMSRLFASGSQSIGAILTVTKFSSSHKLVSS